MKLILALAAALWMMGQPAIAGGRGHSTLPASLKTRPLPPDFDLADVGQDGAPAVDPEDVAPREPVAPRGTDLREHAWNPPNITMTVVRGGPVLAMGAMGSRKKGVPKLAHVVLDWDF